MISKMDIQILMNVISQYDHVSVVYANEVDEILQCIGRVSENSSPIETDEEMSAVHYYWKDLSYNFDRMRDFWPIWAQKWIILKHRDCWHARWIYGPACPGRRLLKQISGKMSAPSNAKPAKKKSLFAKERTAHLKAQCLWFWNSAANDVWIWRWSLTTKWFSWLGGRHGCWILDWYCNRIDSIYF